MEYKIGPNRIEGWEDGELLAEIDFPALDAQTVELNHTRVDARLRGRGVAGELVRLACEQLRAQGRRARVSCSYAAGWLDKHPEYADLRL